MNIRRVGIVGFLQESNTFIAEVTRRAHFESDLLLKGEVIRETMANAPHEVGGFFAGLDEAGIEPVPIFLARALPFGVIVREDFLALVSEIQVTVAEVGQLDGILAAPHGATVAEGYPDADGYWLSELRKLVGNEIPIIATLDPHANLSSAMVSATDALIAYSTNPHLDQRETGMKAAALMCRTLAGEVRPVQAAAFPPLAINIQCQNTSVAPLRPLYDEADGIFSATGVLSGSIILGFPYADVIEMGSSVLVVADGDIALAQNKADAVASLMWERRATFDPGFLTVPAAVSLAAKSPEHPVVLLDMGDNVGGGSPADSTAIVREWMMAGRKGRAFVCLHDSAVAKRACEVGEGGMIDAAIGDPVAPVRGRFFVRSLHDGKFRESQARHGGFSEFDQGPTAMLDLEDTGLVIMVTTRRMAPFSLAQLTTFGVDPATFDLIVAKGVIAPMAAYEPVAKGGFLHVDSPGVTRADMTNLCYKNRRKPLFPFERE